MSGCRDLRVKLEDGTLWVIPASALDLRFSKSGGPGGQNVNKVNTKADLRLDLNKLGEVLGFYNLGRIRRRWESSLDAEGKLQVVCQETRSQAKNVAAALDQMESWLAQALEPEKIRTKVNTPRRVKERRLKEKKFQSERKSLRQKPSWD